MSTLGMVTLPVDVVFAELMEAVHSTRHARFPVIGQSLDDVRGVLDLRELAEPIARGELQPSRDWSPICNRWFAFWSRLLQLLPLIRNGRPCCWWWTSTAAPRVWSPQPISPGKRR